jgi:hypothetical protein
MGHHIFTITVIVIATQLKRITAEVFSQKQVGKKTIYGMANNSYLCSAFKISKRALSELLSRIAIADDTYIIISLTNLLQVA